MIPQWLAAFESNAAWMVGDPSQECVLFPKRWFLGFHTLAAKSCKCTQRKKSYDPPPLPLNSRGSRASPQRNCGLSELSFSAICLLFSWCLVQTSLTWQGVLTYYLPTHPPVPADTGVSHTWSIPENPTSCFLHSLHPSQSTSLIWWWTWCH